MFDRRKVLTGIGSALALAGPGLVPRLALSQQRAPLVSGLPTGIYDTAILDALPGKKPLNCGWSTPRCFRRCRVPTPTFRP